LLDENTHTSKINTENLLIARKEIGLEVKAEKTTYVVMKCEQNAGLYQNIKIHNRCETWLHTLREENRLTMFKNRRLRKTSGPKTDEVTGEWRKLHNEELNDLYSSPYIVEVIK